MLHFYWPLLRAIPRIVLKAAHGAVAILGLGLAVLAFFNRELAGRWSEWDGFSPWWAALPFGLLLAYGLLQANYNHHQELLAKASGLQREASELQAEASEERRRRERLETTLGGLHVEQSPDQLTIDAPGFRPGDALAIGDLTIRHERPEGERDDED